MSKTKKVAVIGVFSALYFVFSVMLKIPVMGGITLDLGYAVLMVAILCFGKMPAMIIGAIGALLESMLMSQRGISPGWICMNAIAGFLCGHVLEKIPPEEQKKLVRTSCLIVPGAMLLGVTVKTFIDCAMYQLSLLVKIPTGITAWILDSLVMLLLGLPVGIGLKKRLKL